MGVIVGLLCIDATRKSLTGRGNLIRQHWKNPGGWWDYLHDHPEARRETTISVVIKEMNCSHGTCCLDNEMNIFMSWIIIEMMSHGCGN